ncbi:MAG: lipopolysaccharide biosynthesis protein [Rhodospirillales bacterium]|jgi:O-antigen/teichoic acid export membrane protein|nr:lipopolysaccharide biosynthesis protein [Rhodospirillales bacterium]
MGRLATLASLGGRGAASIADQASSAAIGFLCSVFIGRYLGAEALGLYAITSVCVLLVSAFQGSIVLEPMSVFGAKKPAQEMPRYYGFLLGFQSLTVGVFTLILGFGALGAHAAGFIGRPLFLALAAAAVYANFICFQYFLRRHFYIEHQQYMATIQSAAYLALVTCGFLGLWWLGGATVVRVYVLLSLCSFAVCLVQCHLLAKKVGKPKMSVAKAYTRDHWMFGRWVLLGVPLGFMNYYGYFFVVASLLDTQSAGYLKAVDVLVAPFNQIAIGLSLMLLPMAARNIDRMSLAEQRRLAARITLPMATLAALYAACVFFAGEYALQLLFPGRMAEALPLVAIMAFLPIFQALPMPAGIILSALQRPYLRFLSYGLSVFGGLAISIPLILSHGLLGAAVGMLTSQILFVIGQWSCLFWLWRRMRKHRDGTAAVQSPGGAPPSPPIQAGPVAAIRP